MQHLALVASDKSPRRPPPLIRAGPCESIAVPLGETMKGGGVCKGRFRFPVDSEEPVPILASSLDSERWGRRRGVEYASSGESGVPFILTPGLSAGPIAC